ncbi:Protein artemis, partial [Toxocara canis]
VLLEFDDGKRVLYTGDFRFVKDDWFSCKALRDPKTKSGFKRIDELYFDSTFCRQGSRVFPSRKRSGALFVRMVKEWLDARTHNKVLIWSSSYGQEFLFRKIYEELQMKVHVTMQKFRAYSKIPEIASFVTCVASSTRVHACASVPDVEELEFEEIDQVIVPSCPNSSNNRQKISTCGLCYPDNDTVRVIKPSVIWFARRKEENVIGFERTNFCRLLYSSHCSFEELIDAFTLLRPVHAFPNVVDKRSKENHEAKIIAFFKRIISEDSLSSVATGGVRSAECSRSRRSMSCDIFSESDDDHEDVVHWNCASAYSSIGIKRKALSGCDMEQPLFKLDRRERNERLVHLVSPEADRRLPSLANGCSKEEVELKCSENDVSVINDLTPHLSDSECDPLVCDGRRELSLESDVEEDRSLRLELSQPLSSTQSSDSSVLWE